MKLRIGNVATLLLISALVLTVCSGCGQKTSEQALVLQQGNNLNMHVGDGFTVFEEYRGFMVSGTSTGGAHGSIKNIEAMKQRAQTKKEKNR